MRKTTQSIGQTYQHQERVRTRVQELSASGQYRGGPVVAPHAVNGDYYHAEGACETEKKGKYELKK